uniref:Uncharacterized protein n=1 Tax=Mycena chlorophos TaxID=658473 RepID=A0ABQ0M3I4_MYCCL|nr:predicted protein [Mycena chlorophos]
MIALILRSGFNLVSKAGTLLLGTTSTDAFKSVVRVCGLAIVGHSVWIPIIRRFHRRPRLAWPDVGERLLKAFALAPLFLIPIWHPRLGPFIQKTLWVSAFVVHSVIPSSNVLHRIVRGLQLWEYENLMLLLGPALIHAVYMAISTTYSSITAMFRPWMHAPPLAISNICLLFALQRSLEAVSLVLMFIWGYFVSLVTWHCIRVGIHIFLAGLIFDPPYLIQLIASYDLWKAARQTQINSARRLLHRAVIDAVLRGRAPWVHFLIVVVPPIAFYIRRGAVPFRRKVRRAWRSFMRLLLRLTHYPRPKPPPPTIHRRKSQPANPLRLITYRDILDGAATTLNHQHRNEKRRDVYNAGSVFAVNVIWSSTRTTQRRIKSETDERTTVNQTRQPREQHLDSSAGFGGTARERRLENTVDPSGQSSEV